MCNEMYYELAGTSDGLAEPADEWHVEAKGNWLCLECYRPVQGAKKVDAHVDYLVGGNCPLNAVIQSGLIVMRDDLISVIGEGLIHEHFYRGNVFDAQGNRYADFSALHSKFAQLFMRGNKKSLFKMCTSCGRGRYVGEGNSYVVAENLTGAPIYESNLLDLVISAEVRDRILQHRWSKLKMSKLPVLEVPRDGLPIVLDANSPERRLDVATMKVYMVR